jgi:hypothetical protein
MGKRDKEHRKKVAKRNERIAVLKKDKMKQAELFRDELMKITSNEESLDSQTAINSMREAIKHLNQKDNVYFGKNIPLDKKNNFHNRVFAELNKFNDLKYLIYCDDTLFGSGDDGWAIISTANDKCIFVIAEFMEPFMIYTLNFNDKNYLKAEKIIIEGNFLSKFKVYFKNSEKNYELCFEEHGGANFINHNDFFKELFE